MDFVHQPVMLFECVEGLNIQPGGIYADATVGGGGHSEEIARRLTTGRLFCFDRDPDALSAAQKRLKNDSHITFVHENFCKLKDVLHKEFVNKIDGILFDLGVSSYQLDEPKRGFSYQKEGPLDMRMSKEGMTAQQLINASSLDEIERILREYGEEKYSFYIAREIVKKRPIYTTKELAEIILRAVPAKARRHKNPCKRSFQAIRIAVNQELQALEIALNGAFELLKKGGRLAVITFHSLEDRQVKNFYAEKCKGCICPPEFPVCICHHKPQARLINKKPITASNEEQSANKRSASAKLRILEKII